MQADVSDPSADDAAVLAGGLRPVPSDLAVGESFAIARWRGPTYGAVLRISRVDDSTEDAFECDVQPFRRRGTGWEMSASSGGTGWFDPPFAPPTIGHRVAFLMGHHTAPGDGWYGCAAYGVAGADAQFVELVERDGVTRTTIESSVGAFVVCTDARNAAVVRVLDPAGSVLMDERFGGYSWATI